MQIIKSGFLVKIVGKCTSKEDILQLWRFGLNKEYIIKQYAKDNKIKVIEARKLVIDILYEEAICKNQKKDTINY